MTNNTNLNEWKPDAHVEFTYIGSNPAVYNGYRPHYQILDNYLTSVSFEFIQSGKALLNVPTEAYVRFLTPEHYPNTLSVGMQFEVNEGFKTVVIVNVLKVYNDILQSKA